MNDLNAAQLARLRRFAQLDLIDSWHVLPATEHESVRVQITTTGEDVATINRVHLDAYLTGLAHGSWLASGVSSRWRRSVLSQRERGAISDGAAIVLGLLVACALSVLWWGWLPLLIVGGVSLVSVSVCLLLARAIALADAKQRTRR